MLYLTVSTVHGRKGNLDTLGIRTSGIISEHVACIQIIRPTIIGDVCPPRK